MSTPNNIPVIWRLLDGKAGHESQTEGLVKSLKQLTECIVADIPAPSLRCLISIILNRKKFLEKKLLNPNIIIGAGHQTHLSLLVGKIKTGAQSIVLMKPSLPYNWFDLCLIPEHDKPKIGKTVITTQGTLNAIANQKAKNQKRVLVLIGGPSKRHNWNSEKLLIHINTIISKNKTKHFIITDSPRTPQATSRLLDRLNYPHAQYFPFAQTKRNWLIEQLEKSSQHWVTEDSISMIYESLTAAGNAFILPTELKKSDKITSSLNKLYQQKYLLSYDDWLNNIEPEVLMLNESMRCAQIIYKRFLRH